MSTEQSRDTTEQSIISDYLTPHQAAEELGISKPTLDRWHALRKGPARTRIGNRVYYRRGALIEWLRTQEQREVRAGA
jgi:predicted DNA-binding transcriptional regulator AlpA